jgi:uncharacterized membrane protein
MKCGLPYTQAQLLQDRSMEYTKYMETASLGTMMGSGSGFFVLSLLTWIVWLIVGVLLIVWLLKKLQK